MSAPDRSALDRATAAWGTPPDWIMALARRCDATSQREAGRVIGYSDSTVSQLLSASYRGNLAKVETKVRAALMREVVECPALDMPISGAACAKHQAMPYRPGNQQAIRLYVHCRRCPHSTGGAR